MGSYISIGIIYGKNKNRSDEDILYIVINSLADVNSIQSYKYAKDIAGQVWIEGENSDIYDYDKLLENLVSNYYASFAIISNKFTNTSQVTILRIENQKDYFSILIDLDEIEVQKAGYDVVENRIIDFLLVLFDKYNYEYAFCDNEGEIELSIKEIVSSKQEIYSISIKPQNNQLIVCKSSYKIDGTSKR